jgi:putative FmdB family regulatory protein
MPIYEYRCKNCAHELEIMQKMADDPLSECPQCGQNSLDKLVSRSSFRLKGGGWYESGYSASKPESVSETKTETSAELKKDNKAENKAESAPLKTAAETKTSSVKTSGES